MVYDLDAAAKEIDAKADEPFKFKYRRKTWVLQIADTLDIRQLLGGEDQSVLDQFRVLLGDKQWAEFPPINAATTQALIEEYSKYVEGLAGESLGESVPPSA